MTSRNYSMIPVFAAVIIIPQLLFWWLAPMSLDAWLAVYIGGSILTAAVPAVCFLTYWFSDLRRAAGAAAVSCMLDIVSVAVSALLLGLDVRVRTAVFVYVITALVYLIILLPLVHSALKEQTQGVFPAPAASGRESVPAPVVSGQAAVPPLPRRNL